MIPSQIAMQMKHTSTPNLILLQILEKHAGTPEELSPAEGPDLPDEVLDELEQMQATLRALPKVTFQPSEASVEAILRYARQPEE